MIAEKLAERFHFYYEDMAPMFSYETRLKSRKPWTEVSQNNKDLMIAVCREILKELGINE